MALMVVAQRRSRHAVTSPRCLLRLLVTIAIIAGARSTLRAGDPPSSAGKPSTAEVRRYLSQLNAPSFIDRQEASKRLFAMGRTVIDDLGELVLARQRESRERAIAILLKLNTSPDFETGKAANRKLQQLVDSRVGKLLLTRFSDYIDRSVARLAAQKAVVHWDLSTVVFNEHWKGRQSDLAMLRSFPPLRVVRFRRAPFRSEGIRQLVQIERIEEIGIFDCSVGDKPLVFLKDFPHLQVLHLARSGVTDRGLVHIAKATKLTWLDLSGNPISDSNLAALKTLKNLEGLDLRGTSVTEAGRLKVAQLLPRAQVLIGPRDES